MLKSPNTGIFLSALGGATLMLGVAYGVASRNHGSNQIETLQASFANERAVAGAQSAKAAELEASLAELTLASKDRLAEAEAQAATQISKLEAQLEAALQAGGGDAKAVLADMQLSAPITGALGLGRSAHPEEIAAWDVDVLPDGRGLPEGSGDVWTGDEVFAEKCASCHGDFAEGRDNWPVLAGGFDTLADRDPVKTVGSYWPYLSTVWDYVHRSMPFGNAGTLTDDEVYAITAYILYSNNLVEDDFVLSRETFLDAEMYNTAGFVMDDRAGAEYAAWRGAPCMENCKSEPAEITRRSTDVGVTPADDGSMAESVMEAQLKLLGGVEWGKNRLAGSVFMGPEGTGETEAAALVQDASVPEGATGSAPDPALVAQGEKAFRRCSSCHAIGAGAKNKTGPQLNDVVGRTIGGLDGFKYSGAFQGLAEEGRIWDEESMSAFLTKPKDYIAGTRMSFAGLRDPADVASLIAYLTAASE